MILGLLQVTVGEQAGLDVSARRPVRVFVDEFQTLPGVDFGAMLSELRKFGASFALATQALAHLDALDKALRPTVMANVDQLYAFSMSAEDARLIERELDGVVDALDLIALDDFTCYARLTVHGQRAPLFSLRLDPPNGLAANADSAEIDAAEGLRHRSQSRIGRPVGQVDAQGDLGAARRNPLLGVRRRPERKTEQETDSVMGQGIDRRGDQRRRREPVQHSSNADRRGERAESSPAPAHEPPADRQDRSRPIGSRPTGRRSHWRGNSPAGGRGRQTPTPFRSTLPDAPVGAQSTERTDARTSNMSNASEAVERLAEQELAGEDARGRA